MKKIVIPVIVILIVSAIVLYSNYNLTIDEPVDFINIPIDSSIKESMANFDYEIDKDFDTDGTIYIFCQDGNMLRAQKYAIDKESEMNVVLPSNINFYISIHENSVMLYKWKIDKIKNTNCIEDFIIDPQSNVTGDEKNNYDIIFGWSDTRHVFRFISDKNASRGTIKFGFYDYYDQLSESLTINIRYQ